jgi:spore germination protein YaaH
MIKKFFLLIYLISLITLLFVNSYSLYTVIQNPQVKQNIKEVTYQKYISNYTDAQIEQKKLEKVNKSTNQQNKLKTIGWIADWGMNNAVQEFERKAKQFDSISPFLFVPNEDGSLKNLQTRLTDRLRNIANQNNVEFIATIPLFDADVLSKILNNEESFKRHVDSIIEVLKKYNFDGIDLDYESTYLADKRLFFDFVEELSKKIKSIGKKFSFTVIAKWGDQIQYNSLPQTRKVQDYKRIADLVDEFRIMTYEFTPRMSRYEGP